MEPRVIEKYGYGENGPAEGSVRPSSSDLRPDMKDLRLVNVFLIHRLNKKYT